MRLYVPATLDELDSADVTDAGAAWTVPGRPAHAVTSALAASFPDEDQEGLEWQAFLAAAHDSLLRVAEAPGGVRLRVVVTVEVPDDVVQTPHGLGTAASEVCVTEDVPGTAVVAVHVDEPDAFLDIDDVLDAAAGDAPGTDAALDDAIQRVTNRDLLWYAPSELGAIPRA